MWSRLLVERSFQGEAEVVRSDGATVNVEFTAYWSFSAQLPSYDSSRHHAAPQIASGSE